MLFTYGSTPYHIQSQKCIHKGGSVGFIGENSINNGLPITKTQEYILEKITRLDGCLGVEFTGQYTEVPTTDCNTGEQILVQVQDTIFTEILAVMANTESRASDSTLLASAENGQLGNTVIIPAGFTGIDIRVLSDAELESEIIIDEGLATQRSYKLTCNDDLKGIISSLNYSQKKSSQSIKIKASYAMVIEVRVWTCVEHTIELPPLPPSIVSAQIICMYHDILGEYRYIEITKMSYGPNVITDITDTISADLIKEVDMQNNTQIPFETEIWYLDSDVTFANPIYVTAYRDTSNNLVNRYEDSVVDLIPANLFDQTNKVQK